MTASGRIDAGTLLSAGSLTVNAGTFAAANITSNDKATITANTTISGQLLSGPDVSVTGPAINLGTIVAGVDLVALASGNIATGSTAHTLIRGGNSVSIEAKSGDINSHGAQIVAGYDENGLLSGGAGDISLKAGNDINLQSAQATNSSSSSSKSAGASIGYSVGVGLGGATGGWTGSAHAGSGKSNSNGTTQVNTHVTGPGNINIESGRDTNLKGAVVEGETITANVGRDLNIISVPDNRLLNRYRAIK
ncbi:hemagglutinin repeat-containing protein [Ochrobactrum sp. BD22]|nr:MULTISPECIES: hemagglutinin repeat-containing protein [unclassified Ochrobactrum]